MGIKDLMKIIVNNCPNGITKEHIMNFKKSKIAIDAELLMHKFRSSDYENSHIYGFVNNVLWHLRHGIIPVYVFDGMPNFAKKNNAIARRRVSKDQLYIRESRLESELEKCLQSNVSCIANEDFNRIYDELDKVKKKIVSMNVSKTHRRECKYLLSLLGVPYLMANEDAEAYCVSLQLNGHVDYVYTEDTDILPYFIGSIVFSKIVPDRPIKIIRTTNYSKNPYNFKNSYSAHDTVSVVNLDTVIKELNISKESFIDMCIVCGCDFCPALPKITHNAAYNLMKQYKQIENFIDQYPYLLDFKYGDARDIFYKNYNQTLTKEIGLGQIQQEQLKRFLTDEKNINEHTINNIVSGHELANNNFKALTSIA